MVSRPAPAVSKVGSHVAVAGGLVRRGLAEAREAEAEVIQNFTGSPPPGRSARPRGPARLAQRSGSDG